MTSFIITPETITIFQKQAKLTKIWTISSALIKVYLEDLSGPNSKFRETVLCFSQKKVHKTLPAFELKFNLNNRCVAPRNKACLSPCQQSLWTAVVTREPVPTTSSRTLEAEIKNITFDLNSSRVSFYAPRPKLRSQKYTGTQIFCQNSNLKIKNSLFEEISYKL